MMLMGAELQAAITAKRGQLKKVPDAPAAPAGAEQEGAGGAGLHDVLRRGLQRFQFADGDGGDTDFIEAAMAKRAPQ
jgi:hypothetical protein